MRENQAIDPTARNATQHAVGKEPRDLPHSQRHHSLYRRLQKRRKRKTNGEKTSFTISLCGYHISAAQTLSPQKND
jgi:hypothetical protein